MLGVVYPSLVARAHRGFVLFGVLVAASLQFLVVKAITSFDMGAVLSAILSQMPERLRAMIGETLISRMGLEGAIAFGFNHPIMMVVLAINSVAVPTRHLSGDIDDGGMEILLSHPVGRARLVLTLWVTGALLNLLIVCGALAGSLAGLAVFGATSPALVRKLFVIASNLWVLSLVIGTVSLLASASAAKGRKPALWVAVAVLSLYVLNFLRALWDALSFTVPLNIFSYYQPQKLMFGEAKWSSDVGVLGMVTAACLILAVIRFRRRDIPG